MKARKIIKWRDASLQFMWNIDIIIKHSPKTQILAPPGDTMEAPAAASTLELLFKTALPVLFDAPSVSPQLPALILKIIFYVMSSNGALYMLLFNAFFTFSVHSCLVLFGWYHLSQRDLFVVRDFASSLKDTQSNFPLSIKPHFLPMKMVPNTMMNCCWTQASCSRQIK